MKQFITTIEAIDPLDGELKEWSGPRVEAETWEEAEKYCIDNLGYCKVTGEFIQEFGWNSALFANNIENQNNN